ncbi:response regulator transcription factor [Carboxylicivirga marina]|uniref:Response regulator transcription factor n=1 Tax=Carboxylicivirga marina TaxID=2800988 RepID=A0ABS1HMS0_9BACT|nr:response regulator transcription factor [Carboxylicivirga marina]MBK3518980.1 response regulator transcription factor [Carboxylicivirga marina]
MIKLVIVEDFAMIREGLKLVISKVEDFEFIGEYTNGKEFIDALPTIEPDVVLTDIDMPVMDGVKMTHMALSLKPDLKIIALTMFADRKFYYKMVTAGAKGFVLKQSPTNELEYAIRDVNNGDNYFSEELLRSVIVEMHGIEKEIIEEKKEILNISDRETEILQLLCNGLSNKEIAEKIFVSLRTVETTKSRLMQKTMTKNNAGLIVWAIKNKVVSI